MNQQKWTDQVNQLLFRIQCRDHRALKKLYDLISPRLFGLISRIVRNEQEAEEALQDCFVKIWDKASSYTGFGSAWGWCCVIARNTALDRIRQGKTRTDLTIDIDSMQESLQNTDSDLFHNVNRCLSHLKTDTRSALLFSLVYGLTHSELADKLQKPLGTVKAWLRRGLIELRTCLQL